MITGPRGTYTADSMAPVQAQAWAEDCGFNLKVTAEEPTEEGSASFCDEVEACPFCPSFKPVQKVPDRVFTPLAKGRMFLSIDFLICGVGHLYGLLRLLSDDDSEADESRDYQTTTGANMTQVMTVSITLIPTISASFEKLRYILEI